MYNFFLKRLRKNNKGFTLIEMIVVISILGVLALLVVPRLIGYTEKARVSADQTLAQSIANACAIYVTETGKVTEDGDDLLAKVKTANLLDIATQEAATAKLKSSSYTSVTVAHNTTTHVITVTLEAPEGGTDFIVTK